MIWLPVYNDDDDDDVDNWMRDWMLKCLKIT